MPSEEFDDILRFWFPQPLRNDHAAMVRHWRTPPRKPVDIET